MAPEAGPSPNHGPRPGAGTVRLVILHYTGMTSAAAARARLCDPDAAVSAHFLVDEDGATEALVDERRRAWHAGVSCWQGERDLNSVSIGIELVNPGHEHGYRPFPAVQIGALCDLLQGLLARHGLGPHAVLGHSDVAPARKEDPGELFPWGVLAARGLAWAPPAAMDPGGASAADDADQHGLEQSCLRLAARVGYCAEATPAQVLAAAQRRLTPGLAITGRATPALRQALAAWAEALGR